MKISPEATIWLGVAIFVGVLLIAEVVRIIAAWREFRQMKRNNSRPEDRKAE